MKPVCVSPVNVTVKVAVPDSPTVTSSMLRVAVSLSVMPRVPVASDIVSAPPNVLDRPDSVRVAASKPSTNASSAMGTVKVWVWGEAVLPVKLSAVGATAV